MLSTYNILSGKTTFISCLFSFHFGTLFSALYFVVLSNSITSYYCIFSTIYKYEVTIIFISTLLQLIHKCSISNSLLFPFIMR